MLCVLGSFPARALDPNLPPSGNFDLSHWYLTLPESGAPIIEPARMAAGYTHPDWFYTGADGAMVFWCPVIGGTTLNSSYPRSELREMIDPLTTDVNWLGAGTHILNAQCKVTQLPSSGKVIIGQIHSKTGNAYPLLKLEYDGGSIDAQVKKSPNASTDAHLSFAAGGLNSFLTYEINFTDGLLSVTINGVTKTMNVYQSDPDWANQGFYFKAGSYCQDNSGPITEGARVLFYALSFSHAGLVERLPIITRQPSAQSVTAGATVSNSVSVTATSPLTYQWRKDGVDLPGASGISLALPNAQASDAGNYSIVVTSGAGSVTSAVVRVTVSGSGGSGNGSGGLPLPEALDATNLVWTTNGSPSWAGQTNVTHDNTDSAESGAIAHGATASMQTTVTGPGNVSFWWKVSSEPSNDRLRFYVNGTEMARISGEVDWQAQNFALPSGPQILEWRYSKNSSLSTGQDRGWVDEVRFGPAPPVLTRHPTSQTVDAGTTVTFNVTATGTPPLSYQWRLEGMDLSDGGLVRGATTSTLTLSNVPLAQAGSYSVVVSNAADRVTSSNALLTVTPVLFLAEALDTPALSWVTSGTPSWTGQTNVTHDGVDAAHSGVLADGKKTSMQTTVTGPGTVSFWWKVSSEPANDRLLFFLGSKEQARISGETNWQWRTFNVASGTQVLKWTYSKNSSKSAGQDRAWVDEVLFIPANVPTAPFIAVQPVGQNVEALAPVAFTVGAAGSMPLGYQWLFNGAILTNGGGVGGAATATLTLANARPERAGAYSVIVSNAAGLVTSADAPLTVAPLIALDEALDTFGLVWTTTGTPSWTGQTNVTYDAADAARSGAIADGGSTAMQTTITGPGTLSFWWKVSSEPSSDRLRFYLNGSEQARITGEVDWERRTFHLASGSQVLQWRYSKNGSVSAGQDRGWVDRVEFVPGVAPGLVPAAVAGPIAVGIRFTQGNAVLSWPATPGKTYQVLYKDDLAEDEWILAAGSVTVAGAAASFEQAAAGNPQRFYLVREK